MKFIIYRSTFNASGSVETSTRIAGGDDLFFVKDRVNRMAADNAYLYIAEGKCTTIDFQPATKFVEYYANVIVEGDAVVSFEIVKCD